MWVHLLEPFARDKWPGDNDGGSFIFRSPGRVFFACPGYNKVRGLYKNYVDGLEGAYAYNAPRLAWYYPPREELIYMDSAAALTLCYTLLKPASLECSVPFPRAKSLAKPMIAIGDSEIVPFS